jgi:hypothetical protein
MHIGKARKQLFFENKNKTFGQGMTRTIVLLRAHKADAPTLKAYDRYAALSDTNVLIVCDERRGPVDMGGRHKIGYDVPKLRDLGLLPHPKCGWRCGDYAYYVARQAFPGYDFYWLTEPDVWVNTAELADVMAEFSASTADFLAARLRPAHAGWDWHRTMANRYAQVYGCIFPITRLSARAIDHAHAARRAARQLPSEQVFATWPNDEVFVATELMNHNFACADLNDVRPGTYTDHSLRTGLPHDREDLLSRPPDGLIYHPVRDFTAWFAENAAWADEAARRLRDEPDVPPLRDHVMRLFRLARTCLERPAMRDAALVPLLVIRGSDREAPTSWPGRDATRAEAALLLARHFAPRDGTAAVARVYRVLGLTHALVEGAAHVDDFTIGAGFDLARFPAGSALAYAACSERRILRFTLHAPPAAVLGAATVAAEQRRLAAFVCDVGWDVLATRLSTYHVLAGFPGSDDEPIAAS